MRECWTLNQSIFSDVTSMFIFFWFRLSVPNCYMQGQLGDADWAQGYHEALGSPRWLANEKAKFSVPIHTSNICLLVVLPRTFTAHAPVDCPGHAMKMEMASIGFMSDSQCYAWHVLPSVQFPLNLFRMDRNGSFYVHPINQDKLHEIQKNLKVQAWRVH